MPWRSRTMRNARYGAMKATIEIHDEVLIRAERRAQRTGCSLRAVVEEGLRRVLDLRVGCPDSPDLLEADAWPGLRELIHAGPRSR